MSSDPYGKSKARQALADIARTHGATETAMGSIWHWINAVASASSGSFLSRVAKGFRTAGDVFETGFDAWQQWISTTGRITFWWDQRVYGFFHSLIYRRYDPQLAWIRSRLAYLLRLIFVTSQSAIAAAAAMVKRERSQRIAAIAESETDTRQLVKALHQAIEREAASAYRMQYGDRLDTIARLLDFAVSRAPVVKTLADDAATAIFDLATIDDPPVRWLIEFAVNEIIKHLGVDKIAGALLHDLVAPILGDAKPHDLHGVIADIGARLVALESQQATFMADGGAEVEQAGKTWRDITGPIGAAAIVAFCTEAALQPQRWADGIMTVIGTPANDIAAAAVRLVKG